MKGHEGIIRMRLAGKQPGWVFLNDFPCKTDWEQWGEYATVCVHNTPISSLDLRFLVGQAVSVSATTENRAKALFKACREAGARMVACRHVKLDEFSHKQTGWEEIYYG